MKSSQFDQDFQDCMKWKIFSKYQQENNIFVDEYEWIFVFCFFWGGGFGKIVLSKFIDKITFFLNPFGAY